MECEEADALQERAKDAVVVVVEELLELYMAVLALEGGW